ncbi:helix-turn-helix domain-containing protein [Chloroflexota bacterium]
MSEYFPESIDEWTYETIYNLVSAGYFETDNFDFKELLVSKGDPNHNLRMSKTAAAFANSRGGFIIFGIKDWKQKLTVETRIVGMDYDSEMSHHFGNAIRNSEPSISYVPGNPPIPIPGSQRVIFIVRIPASVRGPHGVLEDNRLYFYKRTNQGNEPMSHEEIRLAFLSLHERTRKLRLLSRTLADYLFAVQHLKSPAPANDGSVPMSLSELNVGILDVLISDLYVLLPEEDKELWPNLRILRSQAQAINEEAKLFRMQYFSGLLPVERVIEKHNKYVDTLVPEFVVLIQTIMTQLDRHGVGGGVIP